MQNRHDFYRDGTQAFDLTTRAAAVTVGSLNDAERSVEAVFSSENPVPVFDWMAGRSIMEILVADGAEFSDQIPMLDCHNRFSCDSAIGSGRNIVKRGSEIVGRLVFAYDPASDAIYKKVKGRHLRDVSAGYNPIEFTDIEPGKDAVVGGRTYTAGPAGLRVTTRWKLREISVTPIGADQAAKIRSLNTGLQAPQPNMKEDSNMNPQQRAYLVTLGLRADATDAEAQAFFDARNAEEQTHCRSIAPAPAPTPPAPQPIPPVVPAPVEDARSGILAEGQRMERERVIAVRAVATPDIPVALIERAVAEGWDVARANSEFLAHYRGLAPKPVSSGAPAVHTQPELTRDALAGALLSRCGLGDVALRQLKDKPDDCRRVEQAMDRGRRMACFSLVDICREAVRMSGARDPMTGVEPIERDEYIRAGLASGALSYIFTTSVNAAMRQGYEEAPDTSDWVREVDVRDFQTQEELDVKVSGGLERIGPGGIAKQASISDVRETWKIYRFAKQAVLDEMDLINDRLGALNEFPLELGRAARRIKPDMVYSLLIANPTLVADSTALFDASTHVNLTSAALSAASLKAGITAMRKQTWNSININLTPAYLILSSDLEWTARELLQSTQLIIAGTAASVTERGNMNTLYGEALAIRSEPRLSNGVIDPVTGTAYTGTATKWYLAASPAAGRTIKVGYRQGTGRRPQVRSFTLSEGKWGVGWDINMDIGAAAMDYRGMFIGNA